jgi:hypothetical protein
MRQSFTAVSPTPHPPKPSFPRTDCHGSRYASCVKRLIGFDVTVNAKAFGGSGVLAIAIKDSVQDFTRIKDILRIQPTF